MSGWICSIKSYSLRWRVGHAVLTRHTMGWGVCTSIFFDRPYIYARFHFMIIGFGFGDPFFTRCGSCVDMCLVCNLAIISCDFVYLYDAFRIAYIYSWEIKVLSLLRPVTFYVFAKYYAIKLRALYSCIVS